MWRIVMLTAQHARAERCAGGGGADGSDKGCYAGGHLQTKKRIPDQKITGKERTMKRMILTTFVIVSSLLMFALSLTISQI